MSKGFLMKLLSALFAFALIASACGSDDDDAASDDGAGDTTEAPADDDDVASDDGAGDTTEAPADDGDEPDTTEAPADDGGGADLVSLGLWDDGACDASLEPLKVGLQTIFESGVVTLIDQAQALDASAEAFNARGGANGHCIESYTCDGNNDANQALECARELDEEGISVTINDTTASSPEDSRDAYSAAGIPRFAISPGAADYADPNAYPQTAGGTGVSIMMPQGLLNAGVTKVAIVRVDLAAATVLQSFYEAIFADNGLEVVADIPVPAGTTDYTQFILAAQDAGAEGIAMPLGGQEAIQVVRAGQQLDADLWYSGSLGTFPWTDIQGLGEYAERLILNEEPLPATADHPVVDLLTDDLAASGVDALQRANLKTSPMRSWLGLYALLYIIRDSGTEDFSRDNMRSLIEAAEDIPMLGVAADWTPNDQAADGAWTRYGEGQYRFWAMDFGLDFQGTEGNWKELSQATYAETICGSFVGGTC